MAIADDVSITRAGAVRYTGTTANYSFNELDDFLQGLSDDNSASGDDLLDIISDDPSTIVPAAGIMGLNLPYNIDDTLSQHLYGGSLSQYEGDTIYYGLTIQGKVESGTQIQVIQNNQIIANFWGTGINADPENNIITRITVKARENGVDIDGRKIRIQAREQGDTYAEFEMTLNVGDNIGSLSTASDLNNQTAAGTIATWTSITNTEGLNLIDVDNNGTPEEYYSQWNTGTQSINDVYERTKWIQVRGTSETIHGMNGELFRGITHSWPYDGEAGTAPATNDEIAWGLKVDYDNESGGPFAVGDAVYIGGSNAKRGRVLAVDDNGLTGSLILQMEAGTPADNDTIAVQPSGATADVNGTPVGQATGGGTAVLLAVDDDGITGNLYVQITRGTAPADNAICYNSTNAANTTTVNGTPTQRTVSPAFIGQSTGSNIIGAYGIGFEAADVGASDTLFDLTNTQRIPPNNVVYSVNSLVATEDYIMVTQRGYKIKYDNLAGGPFTVGETLTFTSPAGTAKLSALFAAGPKPFMVISEPLTGSGPADNSTITGGTSLATADVDGAPINTSDVGQFGLNTSLTGATETSVVIDATIPGDTPSTGSIRVQNDNDNYIICSYTSYTGSTFIITATDFSTVNATAGNNVHIGYLDKLATSSTESFTSVFVANRNLYIKSRDGGTTPTKSFESIGELTSTGGSITVIRTPNV